MAIARVVTFDGVSSERMAEMQKEMQGNERPESVPAKEMIVLHDPEAEKSLVVVFFETEDDYKRGDEALSAMPAGDTPGKRSSAGNSGVVLRGLPGWKMKPSRSAPSSAQSRASCSRVMPQTLTSNVFMTSRSLFRVGFWPHWRACPGPRRGRSGT